MVNSKWFAIVITFFFVSGGLFFVTQNEISTLGSNHETITNYAPASVSGMSASYDSAESLIYVVDSNNTLMYVVSQVISLNETYVQIKVSLTNSLVAQANNVTSYVLPLNSLLIVPHSTTQTINLTEEYGSIILNQTIQMGIDGLIALSLTNVLNEQSGSSFFYSVNLVSIGQDVASELNSVANASAGYFFIPQLIGLSNVSSVTSQRTSYLSTSKSSTSDPEAQLRERDNPTTDLHIWHLYVGQTVTPQNYGTSNAWYTDNITAVANSPLLNWVVEEYTVTTVVTTETSGNTLLAYNVASYGTAYFFGVFIVAPDEEDWYAYPNVSVTETGTLESEVWSQSASGGFSDLIYTSAIGGALYREWSDVTYIWPSLVGTQYQIEYVL